ncbi:MAG: hypothetical protein ABIL09_09335 [Gemmatimonadota bacterium]
MPDRITVNAAAPQGRIDPLWHGHNLEPTRSCVWTGLSAQLLRNRKFAGMPQRSGVAAGWEPVGGADTWWLLEMPGGHAGSDGSCYTHPYDPKVRGGGGQVQRQRIGCCRAGAEAGIGQRGIPLVAGQRYELRLALRGDRPLAVRISLSGAEPQERRVRVGPDGWREAKASFRAARTTRDARLSIAFAGPGDLFVGAAALLPAGHFHGMRPDVIRLLREIGAPLLRWPGGNFAGDYRWQDGLLPVDERPPLAALIRETLPHTDGYDDHEIGTDEFIALCRRVGAEPFITINMSLEGPDEAAAWVEYCNGPPDSPWGRLRAERGHAEPYGVRYWTLGNEMGYAHMKGPNAPAAYAEAARACAAAMRRVDPSVALTASTGWSKEWYEAVIAGNDGYFEHISAHTYDSLAKAYDGPEGAAELRRLTGMPRAAFCSRGVIDGRQEGRRLTLPDVREIIRARDPAGRQIGIAFDEWNVWYAWYRTPGVADGLYAGAMLSRICRHARQVGMSLGAYFQPVNEGAIAVDPSGCRLTPVGEAMALFRAHHGRQLLAVEGPADGAELEVVASLEEATGRIAVTLVNCGPERARGIELDLAGPSGRYRAGGVLLAADHFRPGSRFRRRQLRLSGGGGSPFAVEVPRHGLARVDLRPRG